MLPSNLIKEKKNGILSWRGILWYIHLYCKLKSSIVLPICKAVSRKKLETQSSIRKGKLKQEDLSLGCDLVKCKNVEMATTRKWNPLFYGC